MHLKTLALIGLVSLLVVLGFALQSSQFASASAQPGQIDLPQPQQAQNPVLQAANGIQVEASNFRLENGMFIADVCFTLPSAADWLLGIPLLETSRGEEITAITFNLIDFLYEDGNPTQRCDWVGFPIEDETEFRNFTLIIPRLETSAPDQLDCSIAQEKLDSKGAGIVVSCYENEVEFSYGFSIIEKPDSLSDEEANRIARDAFIEIVDGPWVFEGSVE